jgi:hypothetical protein
MSGATNHEWEGIEPRDIAMGPVTIWEWVGMAALSLVAALPFAFLGWLAFVIYA